MNPFVQQKLVGITFSTHSYCFLIILLLFGVFCAFSLQRSLRLDFSPKLAENQSGKRRAVRSSAEYESNSFSHKASSSNQKGFGTDSSKSKQNFESGEMETLDENGSQFDSFSSKKVQKTHDFVPTKAMVIIFSIASCAFHFILLLSDAFCAFFL